MKKRDKFLVAIKSDAGVACYCVSSVKDGIKLTTGIDCQFLILNDSGEIVYHKER